MAKANKSSIATLEPIEKAMYLPHLERLEAEFHDLKHMPECPRLLAVAKDMISIRQDLLELKDINRRACFEK